VKPSGPQSVRGSEGGPGTSAAGRYRFTSATLLDLIALAYNVENFQVSSKTPVDRDRYDLVAKLPDGATKEQFSIMLQTLLKDRFRLVLRKETREFSGLELIIGKSGPKFKESVPGETLKPLEGFPDLPAGKPGMMSTNTFVNGRPVARLRGYLMPVSSLLRILQRPGNPPVVDRTGLTGLYDFTLEYEHYTPAPPTEGEPAGSVAPPIHSAIQQQLGLQLVSKRMPFQVLVIESFDKVPSEN
jgi:uncharacterized protein (TIGR03435 family)